MNQEISRNSENPQDGDSGFNVEDCVAEAQQWVLFYFDMHILAARAQTKVFDEEDMRELQSFWLDLQQQPGNADFNKLIDTFERFFLWFEKQCILIFDPNGNEQRKRNRHNRHNKLPLVSLNELRMAYVKLLEIKAQIEDLM